MELGHVKKEFIDEVEFYLKEKENALSAHSGLEELKAKFEHLDSFDNFVNYLNDKLNSILEKYNIEFKNDIEFNEFTKYITPTFDHFYIRYRELGHSDQ